MEVLLDAVGPNWDPMGQRCAVLASVATGLWRGLAGHHFAPPGHLFTRTSAYSLPKYDCLGATLTAARGLAAMAAKVIRR